MKLVPTDPPGRSSRKARRFAQDMRELRAQGYKPRAEQLDESWLVRIRERGHKPLEATFESEAAC